MTPSISPQATTALQEYIDKATTSDTPVLPGAVLHIIDAKNNVLFSYGSGGTSIPSKDSIVIIHSLSKLVGAIAYMQLVERGLASLDDPTFITTHLPELAAKKVLTGYQTREDGTKEWLFEDPKEAITPRMLMNHTYGSGHTYFNNLLFEYFADLGIWEQTNEGTDAYGTVLASPLLFQPGTKTNYGQGLDWIAVLIERLTKQSLEDYLQENIFNPLGLHSTGFEAAYGGTVTSRDTNKGKFLSRQLRTETGFLAIDAPDPVRIERSDAYPNGTYHNGRLGTGLVSSAADYSRLLTILLPSNAGVDPTTNYRLLSPASVQEISSPQLSPHLRSNSRNVPASSATSIILPGILDAPHIDPEGSYGLACGVQGKHRVLANGKRGRSKGSVYWYGAANTECWVDGEKGVVVFVNGNYYPWNDEAWVDFVAGVEGKVYEGLVEKGMN